MAKMEMILERIGPGRGPENFQLWACRGEGRGCDRNKRRTAKKHCENCLRTRNDETLAQLQARLSRGDA